MAYSVVVWNLLLVFVHIVRAQDCLKNFAAVEKALLDSPENTYQIANAFFRPRSEGETLCVTAYYYLGLNSTEEDKSNCPSITSNEDGVVSGCSKWKWCVNTFYMDLDLAQLQIFSFFAIYERVSEVELRTLPFCVSNDGIVNEYLLRVTTSLRLYAEGNRLDDGRPFVGYSARYITPEKLEPLNKDVDHNSLNILFDSTQIFNSDFNDVDAVFLLLSLLALPTFVAPLCSVLFIDLRKKAHKQVINNGKADFLPFIVGLTATCVCGIVLMFLFQIAGFFRGGPWYYVIPYCWLWTLILIQFVTSFVLTYRFMSMHSEMQNHCCRPSFWVQSFALWIVFTAALLLSWHAVFMMLGLILDAFRTILLTAVYAIGVVCVFVFFSVIFSFLESMYSFIKVKKCHCYFAVIYFLLMIAILTFIISYISFLFRTHVGGNNNTGADSVTEWANNLLPPLFLLTLTWILNKLIKLPKQLEKNDNDEEADSPQLNENINSNSKEEVTTV